MKKKSIAPPKLITRKGVRRPSLDAWEKGWQNYWAETGASPYELPPGPEDQAQAEYQFLMTKRTVDGEKERLKRINNEFIRGFKALYKLGPAVTVFGSARFKENHK